MKKGEVYRLCDYLINSSRFWHLEFAKKTLIPSEYNKIVKERDKFDNLLRKRVDSLLSDKYSGKTTDKNSYNQIFNEEVIMIKEIKIYTDSDCIVLSKDDYTNKELNDVKEVLNNKEGDINLESFYKHVYIEKIIIKGYEIEYTSSYEDAFKKGGI